MGKAEDQFAELKQVVHLTSRDDYFASMLACNSPLGLGDTVRYDHSTGMWHIWNGVLWEPDKTTKVYDLVRERLNVWMSSKDINPSESSAKIFATLMDYGKKSSVLKMMAALPGIAMKGDEWDQNPKLMGFNNGVLDLETLVLNTTPDPSWLVSRSTGYDYDENADMQPFFDFIEDITSHDADVAVYLLRMLGYSMLGSNQEQKFWMWVGRGSNGKGILARTVTKALGDYAYSPPDTLYMRNRFGAVNSSSARPELLKLQGTRFTFMSEPQGGQFNEELLKAHTGNDPIEARTLYSSRFKTFTPTHKVVFLTNEMPKTDDVGPSMQRRVRVIKFMEDYSPTSTTHVPDNTLEARLQTPENLQGALRAMAVQAHQYLMTNSLPEPQQVLDWSKAYIEENDPLSAFIDAMTVPGPGEEASSGALYKAFRVFCEQNGHEEMTMNAFGRAMQARYPRKTKASGSFYTGLRLKNMTDATDGDE